MKEDERERPGSPMKVSWKHFECTSAGCAKRTYAWCRSRGHSPHERERANSVVPAAHAHGGCRELTARRTAFRFDLHVPHASTRRGALASEVRSRTSTV